MGRTRIDYTMIDYTMVETEQWHRQKKDEDYNDRNKIMA